MSQNRYKILVVEDEKNIQNIVSTVLTTENYQVIIASDGKEAMTMYNCYLPDLILLDLGLPDCDGMCFLEDVRKTSNTPIIVLSARSHEEDKVKALDSGANDYITKPFGSLELLARVRTALRTTRLQASKNQRFILKDLEIDYDARQVFIAKQAIKLTQTEYNIVALLSYNSGKMMTYSAIIKAVWGDDVYDGSIKKLQVNMANIRKKFGAKPGESSYIINELGVGYRMAQS